jgi:hypothetical protein
MDRKTWDRIVSTAGAVVAIALIALGAVAIYGGQFGRDNVQDRLTPEAITFPPYDAMTPQEQAEVGDFAGQQVDTGPEAEAFSRYIAGHLAEVNEGKTYDERKVSPRRRRLTSRRRRTSCSRARRSARSC